MSVPGASWPHGNGYRYYATLGTARSSSRGVEAKLPFRHSIIEAVGLAWSPRSHMNHPTARASMPSRRDDGLCRQKLSSCSSPKAKRTLTALRHTMEWDTAAAYHRIETDCRAHRRIRTSVVSNKRILIPTFLRTGREGVVAKSRFL